MTLKEIEVLLQINTTRLYCGIYLIIILCTNLDKRV